MLGVGVVAHLAQWAAGAAAGERLRERLRSEDGGPLVRTLVRTPLPPCGGGYWILRTDNQTRAHRGFSITLHSKSQKG